MKYYKYIFLYEVKKMTIPNDFHKITFTGAKETVSQSYD